MYREGEREGERDRRETKKRKGSDLNILTYDGILLLRMSCENVFRFKTSSLYILFVIRDGIVFS